MTQGSAGSPEMVARVADVLRRASLRKLSRDEAARLAIEAMREPTEAMQNAGVDRLGFDGDESDARSVWTAMMAAALAS